MRGHFADYVALTKPRVVAMVLVTTLAGFYLGSRGGFDFAAALSLVVGTALAAAGTLALNQYIERELDARMDRTRKRPLPDGRMRPAEALVFGVAITTAGVLYLGLANNWLCAGVIAAIAIVYLCGYTPLKRVSWVCNLVGAIPGALPPVAGWAAARGSLTLEPFAMFAIMFLWQLPHSLAIARLYQKDYARAGLWLLPRDTPRGNAANPVIVAATLTLIVAGMMPTILGYAGMPYLVVAVALGAGMFACGLAMVWAKSPAASARRLLFASLVYLPVVLLVMVLDKVS
ncbi:MAG TPA: heme o synthase [Candidatus Binataceae bacterium]